VHRPQEIEGTCYEEQRQGDEADAEAAHGKAIGNLHATGAILAESTLTTEVADDAGHRQPSRGHAAS